MRLLNKIISAARRFGSRAKKWITGGGMDRTLKTIHDVSSAVKPIAGERGGKIINKIVNTADGAGNAARQAANGNIRGAISTAKDTYNRAKG